MSGLAEVDGVAAGFMVLTDATVEAPAQLHLVAVEEWLQHDKPMAR